MGWLPFLITEGLPLLVALLITLMIMFGLELIKFSIWVVKRLWMVIVFCVIYYYLKSLNLDVVRRMQNLLEQWTAGAFNGSDNSKSVVVEETLKTLNN